MKILFVWRKYNRMAGGVERMSIAMMNEMVRRGHDVSLLSWDQAGAQAYYEMDPAISWHKLDSGDPDRRAGWGLRFSRALAIRRYIGGLRPDVTIAFMDGVFLSVKLSVLGLGLPVIEAERCSAARFDYLASRPFKPLIFQSLRLARFITVQLESYRKDYPAYLHRKIVSIPNPVYPAKQQADTSGSGSPGKTLLSVGRLSYQKNYTVLIKAFAEIAKDFPEWNLVIVGEGEEKKTLEALISSLGLGGRITLEGATIEIEKFYAQSQLFCLPSRWEGFPNTLAEALAHGLPAAGFSECLGVCDLIEDGKNGLLAKGMDNVDTLAGALGALMAENEKRRVMGAEAARSVSRYTPDKIFDQWEELFHRAAGV